MTGKEMLEKLQTFSEAELNRSVYICGANCIINPVESIDILESEYEDEDGYIIPAGALVIDWKYETIYI